MESLPSVLDNDDFEQRLHVNSMSDSEINEALEETLPEGWIPVAEVQKPFLGIGSGTLKDVYYWNTVTDEVTWLHPKNRPEADLEHARTLAHLSPAERAAAENQAQEEYSKTVEWPPRRPPEEGTAPTLPTTMNTVKVSSRSEYYDRVKESKERLPARRAFHGVL